MSTEESAEAAVKIAEYFRIALVVAPRHHHLVIAVMEVVFQQADGVSAEGRSGLDKTKGKPAHPVVVNTFQSTEGVSWDRAVGHTRQLKEMVATERERSFPKDMEVGS